jgi:hypothetical protein
MFKTALRLSALTLIVAGAFYCGRATTSAKSEFAAIDKTAPAFFQPSDLRKMPTSYCNIEFQLQKTMRISAWAKETPLPAIPSTKKATIPNHFDMLYYLEWDEENNCFYYNGEKIDKPRDASLFNRWCIPGRGCFRNEDAFSCD